jgi:hypothetical protein
MKALSIKQPWAWLIVAGHKLIENRSWSTRYRGPLLIHASMRPDREQGLSEIELRYSVNIERSALHTAGVVGRVELIDVVTTSDSRWFKGPFGWVLANPVQLPFMQATGRRRLFDLPDDLVPTIAPPPRAASLALE